MESEDLFYFWRKGVFPYVAKDLKDYLENRDLVRHRRHGILVVVRTATLEIIPE